MDLFKQKIKNSFDKGSIQYDSNSTLQKEVLKNLLDLFFSEIKNKNEKFSLLDIGCGTGICSKKLSQRVFLTKMHLLDISTMMIEKAKLNLTNKKVLYLKHDFDSFENFQNYNLLVSNMSIHWSMDFLKLIKKILNSIKKNSVLLLSFPNSNSFFDLKKKHKKFTNDFPDIEELKFFLNNSKYYYSINNTIHKSEFDNIFFFLNSLKKIGANVSNNFSQSKDLYKLRRDKEKIKVSFDISYLFVRKIEN